MTKAHRDLFDVWKGLRDGAPRHDPEDPYGEFHTDLIWRKIKESERADWVPREK